MRVFLFGWMPVGAWMLLIFIGSTSVLSAEHTSRFLVPFLRWLDPTIAPETIAKVHFLLRKFGHLTEYAILATLLWRAWRLTSTGSIPVLASFGVAALFAVSDEIHQFFIPSRTASPRDVLIDAVGAALAIALCWMRSRRRLQA
jgi:VanZ family protein